MSTLARAFYVGLYEEHLEEASFLYDQRRALLQNPEIAWPTIGEFEERCEAHIDALVVGGDLALEVCQARAAAGDAGELHAAVRVFCRQKRQDLFLKTLEGLDPEDADKAGAWADAFCHELPADWQGVLTGLLDAPQPRHVAEVARVIGQRRLKDVNLAPVLTKAPLAAVPAVIWALGRLGDQNARPQLLSQWLKHAEAPVRLAAALALLRLGEVQVNSICLPLARSQSWTYLPLGLGGGRSAALILLDALTSGQPNADCLLALGLQGDIGAVDKVTEFLGDPKLSPSAALALHLITGAEPREQVFVPESADEDDKADKPAPGPGGRAPGITVSRLSQKIEDWQTWWSDNLGRFSSRIRYRLGRPYSPAILLDMLEAPATSHQLRRLVGNELAIRYGTDAAFETDMFVAPQRQALADLRHWVQANASRFKEGGWYLHGQALTS